MRGLPLIHQVAHLPINTNLLISYVSVSIRRNILNSSLSSSKSLEANPWCKLYMLFSQPRFYLTFPPSCVWNSAVFPTMFYKLFNANSTVFLFFVVVFLKCLFVFSDTLHFTLFTTNSTLFRSSFFLFLILYLQKKEKEKNIYRKS